MPGVTSTFYSGILGVTVESVYYLELLAVISSLLGLAIGTFEPVQIADIATAFA